ncbi:DUF6571 family protein [Streptomyces spongiicola]|uniref:DUF6571 family protein n=1 Tax=Streptomyces spongiicola TaxID=1690221 RepID=UPI0033CC74EA
MDLETLRFARFGLLEESVADWTTLTGKLAILKRDADDGLRKQANQANWTGENEKISKQFIGRTAGEFADAHAQAVSIRNILRDTCGELKDYQARLNDAIARGLERNLTVVSTAGGGFTVSMNIHPDRAARGTSLPSHTDADVTALRDEVQRILDGATQSDSSATRVLTALVDLTDYGFAGVDQVDRDSAITSLRHAERLASLAKKSAENLTVEEFDELNAGLEKYSGDEMFAEHFAKTLGARGTLEFWAGINAPYQNREVFLDRREQYDQLQKHLSLTLATATQADTPEMSRWKYEVTDLGSQTVGKHGTMGFQVMSNLMRWGDFEDQFLRDYGSALMETEKRLSANGSRMPAAWAQMGMDPDLNRTGTDSGSDPVIGFMKALSNNPEAATDFFNDPFVTKDEDHEFLRDTDGDGNKGKVGLSNFHYLFEERDWPLERDDRGEESIAGRNNLALALEAATTGHPAGEMPTQDTPAHNSGQAKLVERLFASVSENPERLTKYGYMSDSLGQITAEYMPDVHRGLHPGEIREAELFPVSGSTARLDEVDVTRFLYTVGQNPDGYAAVNAGLTIYTASLMGYHFAHPDAYLSDRNFDEGANLRKTIEDIGRIAGEIEGTIGAGRAYSNELDGGAKDQEFNDAIQTTSTWVGTGIGIGVGLGTAPLVGPGAVVAGDVAGTAADEILGGITEGLLRDSSGEVIYSNGREIEATRDSTYMLVETAAQKAGESTGNPSPHIVSAAATAAEEGFNNAQSNLDSFIEGQGVPRQLDTKEE